MTSTMTVQPPDGILVPLATVIVPAPAVAVTPVQVPPKLFGVPMTMLPGVVGKVSVSALLRVIALALGLPKVRVNWVLPLGAMLAAAKLLLMVGTATTLRLAVAATALLPALVTKAPMGMVLV